MNDAAKNSDSSTVGGSLNKPNKSTRRLWVMPVLWIAICGGLITWGCSLIECANEAARCAHCQNNLHILWFSLNDFHSINKSFPPAYLCNDSGNPMHSWRSLIIQYDIFYDWRKFYDLKEPWDSPQNLKCDSSFDNFQCPNVNASPRSIADYVAVVGPDTFWPGKDRFAGPLGGENADKILLIEMPDSDYRGLEPRSPTVEEFMEKIKSPTGKGIRLIHSKGLAYLTVAGEVRWFPPDTDPDTIRQLLKRSPDSEIVPAEEKLPTVEDWSKHPRK
jgi:hypothetical protein